MNENAPVNVTGAPVVGTGDNSSSMTWVKKKLRDIVPVLKRPPLKTKEFKNDR